MGSTARKPALGTVCLLVMIVGCSSSTDTAPDVLTAVATSAPAASAAAAGTVTVPASAAATGTAPASVTTRSDSNKSADVPCGTTTTSMVNTSNSPLAMMVTYTCYDVTGGSAQAIRTSIDASAARPVDPQTGTAYDAYTRWLYELKWTLATSGGACRATVSATLTITHTFPHWVASGSAPSAPLQEWTTYLSALRTHEDGHKQIGIDTTNDAVTRVSALGVASCGEFNAKAQAAIDAATARGKQVENEYDTATSHGATQGARFP